MNEKSLNWVIGILGVLLGVIVVLVIFHTDSEEYVYEGPGGEYQFVYAKSKGADVYFNYMSVFIEDKEYNIPLRSNPYDLEYIPLDLRARDEILMHGFDKRWMKTTVEFTQKHELANLTNQGSVLGSTQIDLVVGIENGLFGLLTERGFSDVLDDPDYDTITCDDATSTHSVIDFRYGEPSIFVERDNCVVIQGNTKENIMQAADKLVMHLVGAF
tara:strand:- start:1381 stop:2025 length:645 start_codon:yes stop_codon:yes gene_type:complete